MSMLGPMYGFVAALLTRMSSTPNRSTVPCTHASAWSGAPALVAKVAPLSLGIVAATSSRASALREDNMTLAPAAANATAVAAPIPREAPVISAVLPARLISVIGDLRVGADGRQGAGRRAAHHARSEDPKSAASTISRGWRMSTPAAA